MHKKVFFVIPPQWIPNQKEEYTREGCQCSKTNCLKLYCQCFHEGKECGEQCGCLNCKNNKEEDSERQQAIKKIIHKYKQDSVQKLQGDTGQGCSCKKSKCKLNYCECYVRGKGCGDWCKCKKCANGKIYKKKINNKRNE